LTDERRRRPRLRRELGVDNASHGLDFLCENGRWTTIVTDDANHAGHRNDFAYDIITKARRYRRIALS
jgi:hypothetical protein